MVQRILENGPQPDLGWIETHPFSVSHSTDSFSFGLGVINTLENLLQSTDKLLNESRLGDDNKTILKVLVQSYKKSFIIIS